MTPADYQFFDLHRVFIGDLPWTFTIEIIIRTVVMYLYTLWLVRMLGKRVAGQLSLVEFMIVVAIGSAVGDPMLYPDVPLLHGFAVVTVVVLMNRGLRYAINNVEAVETYVEGKPVLLVHKGRINLRGLDTAHVSQEALFEQLRLEGIEHLGEVRTAYIEQGGLLSVFRFPDRYIQQGLYFTPPWDLVQPASFSRGDVVQHSTPLACKRCGTVRTFDRGDTLPACDHCDHEVWTDAVCIPNEAAS